jgi:diguanylate cyclase (GGDEF)-like protein
MACARACTSCCRARSAVERRRRRRRHVERILPGESVGEQSVLDDAANLTPMTALEDSELLVIEPDLVWSLIDATNGVARNLLRLLSFRIRAANALLRRRQKLGEFYRQLSINDGLTGPVQPRLAERHAAASWSRSAPGRRPAVAGDDRPRPLQAFNDTHGHMAGDTPCARPPRAIRDGLRPTDFAVRYGGEEMMAILPDTSRDVARAVAERLCERMREAVVFDDMRLAAAARHRLVRRRHLLPGQDERALVAAADAALYRAKQAGRDRSHV